MLPLEQVYAADPVSSAGEQTLDRTRSIPDDFARQGEAIRDEFQDDVEGIIDSPEDLIGEDIIVQVEDYQPRIIRSSLLEDTGIFVHALLSGTPTNPTITIPRIRNIVIRSQKVTTVPAGLPVSIGRITHVIPQNRDLSYSNLGTIVIPIRQIPQEGKVPDEIIIDVDARIFFEVSEGLFFGPVQDILTEQGIDEWKLTKEDHSFYAGYLQATEIKSDKASFMVYDNQLNELTNIPVTLAVGQTSRSLNANRGGFVTYGRLFDRYTLRLDSIKSIGDKVRLIINKNGNIQTAYLTEGEEIYSGSPWYVESIASDVKQTYLEVTLRNKILTTATTLKATKAEILKPEEAEKKFAEKKDDPNNEKKKRFIHLTGEYRRVYNKEENSEDPLRADYITIARAAAAILNDQTINVDLRDQVITLINSIRNFYVQKRNEYLVKINLVKTNNKDAREIERLEKLAEDAQKKFDEVETILKASGTPKKEPSSTPDTSDPTLFYRLAIAEYEKVIANYPNVKDRAAAAHWKIANLAMLPGIDDRQGALNHLAILLQNYQPADYAGITDRATIQRLIKAVNELNTDFQSFAVKLDDRGSTDIIYVTLIGGDAVPDSLKAKATLEIEGLPSKEYREGEILLQENEVDTFTWYVKEIKDNEVVLQEEKTERIESIMRGEQKQLVTGKNKKRIIKVVKTDTKKEAHVTITPNTEAAFSEAPFSLHLPIEKRALDIPLFSDSIEEEIAKTEDLLAKLDKIIDNVGKLTEYWKKFCFITFAVVWVKNFFSGALGGTGALARERTNEAFEKKYDYYRTLGPENKNSCRNLSYDECVFKNQAEYNKMTDEASTAITEINRDNYNKQAFNLGPEYEDTKKDLGYYENLAKQDPANQAYRDKYYEIEARLARAQKEKEFGATFFDNGRTKSYDEVKAANVDPDPGVIVGRYKDKIQERFDVKKELVGKDPEEQNRLLWRKYSTRFLPWEREWQISESMKQHFIDIRAKGTSFSPGKTSEDDNKHLAELEAAYGLVTVTELEEFNHNPAVTVFEQGRQKGSVETISVDALYYVQVSYSTGGRPAKYELWKRSQPNGRIGGPSDVYMGVVDGQMLTQYKKAASEGEIDPKLPEALKRAQDCIGEINKKNAGGKYARGEVIPLQSINCGGLGAYTIETSAASIGPSCTEFMSPSDCKLLFNACDPVICPPSRCNLGGKWQVDNVIQTGIIGSAVLCLHNNLLSKNLNAGGVVMPVCLSGIYAGLQNIRSVVEGYRQCLITSKVSGRSVGICDRLRSFGICEILWKEGMAIFSTKKGLARIIFDFFRTSEKSGGSEYSSFEQAIDNSVGSLQYFTQTYAKNTFALYNGGALPELGSEICKAAIFGKAPGLGNLFNQISKPESPPQFTAFFDEAPYSDLGNQPLSQYKVTYHLYAGDNEDIMYTIYMQAADPYNAGTFVVQPHILKDSKGIIRNRRLARGTFASESPDLILPAGLKEICVEINGRITGRKVECGFGKVSTGFAINYVSDQLAQSEAKKQINSAEECVPTSAPSITEEGFRQGNVLSAGLGSVSSGFIETGIIRKCSKFNPGVGGDEEKWSPVGTCGQDDRERDLGTCWLYIPAAQNAIKERSARLGLNDTLAKTTEEYLKEVQEQEKQIPGYYTLTPEQIKGKENEASEAITKNDFEKGRALYQEILGTALIDEETAARIQYLMAVSYEKEAQHAAIEVRTAAPATPSPSPGTTTNQACAIKGRFDTQKYWGDKGGISLVDFRQTEDEIVTINLEGENCNPEELIIKVFESDTAYDDIVATIPQRDIVKDGNKIQATWKAKYEDDEVLGIDTDPEMIVKVYKTTDRDIPIFTGKQELTVIAKPISSTTTASTPSTKQSCVIEGAFGPQKYWGDKDGNALNVLRKNRGDIVTINLKTENCEEIKDDLIIRVLEKDVHPYFDVIEDIANRSIIIEGNNIKATWKTKYEGDTYFFNGDPEMFVVAYYKSKREEAFTGEQELSIDERATPHGKEVRSTLSCSINKLDWYNGSKQKTERASDGDRIFIGFEATNCNGKDIDWEVSAYFVDILKTKSRVGQLIRSTGKGSITPKDSARSEQIYIPITLPMDLKIQHTAQRYNEYQFKLTVEGVEKKSVFLRIE